MRLHENQLKLIHHLARFNLLDYSGCLHMLDETETGDQVQCHEVKPRHSRKARHRRPNINRATVPCFECHPYLPGLTC